MPIPLSRTENSHKPFSSPAAEIWILGFVTLAVAIVMPKMITAADSWTHGVNGITVDFGYLMQGGSFGLAPIAFLVAATTIACLGLHVAIRRTRLGRSMIVAAASPEAAQSLGISYETVKEHVQHILRKIGVSDRTQAAVWAVRRNLV